MRTGWQVINGRVYYFNEANDTNMGYALRGWQNISGILCHFDETTYHLSALNPPETLAAVYQHLLIVDYQN
jgi:glucan-binding YG repeat protein